MLARLSDDTLGNEAALSPPVPLVYRGFHSWRALLVTPGNEIKTMKFLHACNFPVYVPAQEKLVRYRNGGRRLRHLPLIPGYAFAPDEVLDDPRRDVLLERAGIRGFLRMGTDVVRVSKADIERIRLIE